MCLLLDRRPKLSETVPPNRTPGDLTAAVGWTHTVDFHQGFSLLGKHPGTSLPHLQCFILRPNSKATLGHRPQLSQAALVLFHSTQFFLCNRHWHRAGS